MNTGVKPVESVQALPQGEMDALLLGRIKELPVVDTNSNNWKGMTIAVMVILAICGAIASSVVLINPEIQSKFEMKAFKEKLKLDQVLQGAFSAPTFNGSWISDNELIYRDISGNLVLLDLNSEPLIPKTLVHNLVFRQNIVQKYSLSSDRKYLLLVSDIKKLFRHTYIAKHKIYNIETEEITLVTPPNDVTETDLQFASWGPKPNTSQLVFISKNTIYYRESALSNSTKVIVRGNQNDIFNGIPDWVYEEEVLSSSNAIWWSPDGSKLCFASFNDTQVDLMQYPWYGSGIETSNLYTQTIQIRYPKAGRPNPTVELLIADLDISDPSTQLKMLTPPQEMLNDDYYFTTISWTDSQEMSVTWLKRVQNHSILSFCSAHNNWNCVENLDQKTNGKGWIDMYETPLFTESEYFLRLPNNKTKENYRHIARVLTKTGDPQFITEGPFDTLQVLAISRDELSGIQYLYYASTLPEKPGERHIFRVLITSTRTKTASDCLTCDLGDQCLYNNAIFSSNSKYYVLECNGPQIPKIELRRTEDNSIIMTLQTNDRLTNSLTNKLLPNIKKFKVPMEGSQYNLSVMLYMPPDFRDDEIVKYPLLIQVYGGPGSQMVTERFQINWGTYLASTKNIIYAFIDGRGSGNQGDTLMHELYLNLGTVEVEDQIAVARYLRDNFNYVNKDAIGIWGWSYGGYATALALAMDNNNPVFSCGVSVAPVTSWLLYDSVYTERYMGLPKDNMESYLRSDVLNRANNFKGKKFLICHGSADDNVHIQQSMVLMKALTNANVMFQTQVYPDENHALSGVKTHLYHTMEAFWDECFQLNSYYEDIGLRRRRVLKQSQS